MFEGRGDQFLFSYNIWINKLVSAAQIPGNNDFPGLVVYNALRFPNIGAIVKRDPVLKNKKMLLYCSYNAGEYLMAYQEKITFKEISEAIVNRQ